MDASVRKPEFPQVSEVSKESVHIPADSLASLLKSVLASQHPSRTKQEYLLDFLTSLARHAFKSH